VHIYVIVIVCIMEVIKWKFQRYEFILILLPCLWFEVVAVPKVLYFDLTTRYVHFYFKQKKGKKEECIGISVGQIHTTRAGLFSAAEKICIVYFAENRNGEKHEKYSN